MSQTPNAHLDAMIEDAKTSPDPYRVGTQYQPTQPGISDLNLHMRDMLAEPDAAPDVFTEAPA